MDAIRCSSRRLQPPGAGASARSPGRGQVPPTPRPVVPFDLTLEGAERCILLSGPNTGGKSVLLKGVGLIAALTQSGIVPPVGPGSALPIFERVFADIGDRQSIAASLSTFSAHLALLRVILSDADERSLVLLDEIGSGTDPAEGGALAAATLMALTRRGAVTIATTHLGEPQTAGDVRAGIVNASLQFDAATLQPTYRLLKGVPGRSYGLAIARRLGLREDVLAEAEAQVPEAERSLDALLAAVEERERAQMAARPNWRTGWPSWGAAPGRSPSRRKRRKSGKRRSASANAMRSGRRASRRAPTCWRRGDGRSRDRQGECRGGREQHGRRGVWSSRPSAEEAGALRGLEGADRRTGGPADGLEAGARVRMESGTVGEVLEVRGDGKLVLRVGSLKLVADPGSLSRLPDGPASARPSVRPSALSVSSAPSASFELDLRGMTGDEAEHAVVAALDAAVLAEQPSLRIIHGKGTGVVRERVQQVLTRDRRVRSHAFAPANQGGSGVTVAELA